MSSIAILREVKQLYNVSDRLDSLADQHPVVSEALNHHLGKCSQYRHVVGGAGCDENRTNSRIRSRKCVILSKLLGVRLWEFCAKGKR
jgi:hypothetical protein